MSDLVLRLEPYDHALWFHGILFEDNPIACEKEVKWKASMARRRDTDFETFYERYPLKIHKPAAMRAWHAALRRGNTVQTIMNGLAACEFPADPTFVLHPTTWLNNDGWVPKVYTPPARTAPDCRSKTGWMDQFEDVLYAPDAPIIEGVWE